MWILRWLGIHHFFILLALKPHVAFEDLSSYKSVDNHNTAQWTVNSFLTHIVSIIYFVIVSTSLIMSRDERLQPVHPRINTDEH